MRFSYNQATIAKSEGDLQEMIVKITEKVEEFGIEINFAKTKVMGSLEKEPQQMCC